jgi:hypothetical protein
MVMSRHRNAGQNHNLPIASTLFVNVVKVKYLGTTVTNQIELMKELRAG